MSYVHKCNLHSLAISLLALLGRVTGVNNIMTYSQTIIEARREEASHWLPDLIDPDSHYEKKPMTLPHLLIDKVDLLLSLKTIFYSNQHPPQVALVECLQNADMDTHRLANGQPYGLHQVDQTAHRTSWVDASTAGGVSSSMMSRASLADINSSSLNASMSGGDLDSSVNSSPVLVRKSITVDLNFDAMKRSLAEPTDSAKREQRDRKLQITKAFREANFEDLMRRTEPKHDVIQTRLNDLFTALAVERQIQAQSELKNSGALSGGGGGTGRERPIYENHFPELFYY